jgi:hypothetical protein
VTEVHVRTGRRRSGGFFRPQPWLQSARDLPHPSVGVLAAVVVAVVGIWTAIALISASGQPTLPSSHAVLVSVKPTAGHSATGGGHLIWYQSGGLLVVVLGVKNLQPHTAVTALLVPKPSCSGPRPSGTRVIGTATANGQGIALLNQEVLGVSNLKFSTWAIWIVAHPNSSDLDACSVISLSAGALNSS